MKYLYFFLFIGLFSCNTSKKLVNSFLHTFYEKNVNESLAYLDSSSVREFKTYFWDKKTVYQFQESHKFEMISMQKIAKDNYISKFVVDTDTLDIRVARQAKKWKIVLNVNTLIHLLNKDEGVSLPISRFMAEKRTLPVKIVKSWYQSILQQQNLEPEHYYLIADYYFGILWLHVMSFTEKDEEEGRRNAEGISMQLIFDTWTKAIEGNYFKDAWIFFSTVYQDYDVTPQITRCEKYAKKGNFYATESIGLYYTELYTQTRNAKYYQKALYWCTKILATARNEEEKFKARFYIEDLKREQRRVND